MSNERQEDDTRERYVTMRTVDRQRFLAAYAHELTVLARAHFEDREWEAARQCNESIHRIVGHLASSSEERDLATHQSFFDMLLAGAQARGWSWILRKTMLRTLAQDARQ